MRGEGGGWGEEGEKGWERNEGTMVGGTASGTETYKRNRRNTQVAIEPISSKYHLKQVGKRCERPGLLEGVTAGVKSREKEEKGVGKGV